MKIDIPLLYQTLLSELGPQGWWPAESKPEILLGAILVQNTNWQTVEQSLANLKQATQFLPERITSISLEELEQLIRPSGFYKNKAKTIKHMFTWMEDHQWDYQAISQDHQNDLRSELLTIKGIGYETADVLMVYLFDRPVFIADSYARRLFGWLLKEEFKTYDSLYRLIQLPDDFTAQDANELHALIDEFGKIYLQQNSKQTNPFHRQIIQKK